MIVVWTPEAEQDRADIWDYIAADNPGAAVRMDELFSDVAARLAAHPKMGKAGWPAASGRTRSMTRPAWRRCSMRPADDRPEEPGKLPA